MSRGGYRSPRAPRSGLRAPRKRAETWPEAPTLDRFLGDADIIAQAVHVKKHGLTVAMVCRVFGCPVKEGMRRLYALTDAGHLMKAEETRPPATRSTLYFRPAEKRGEA